MSKKILAVLSILLMTAFILAACQPAAPAATEEAAPAEPAAPAATEAPAQPAGKPVLAVALPALDNPLMLAFNDAFKGLLGINSMSRWPARTGTRTPRQPRWKTSLP